MANPNDFDYFRGGEPLAGVRGVRTSGFDYYRGGEPDRVLDFATTHLGASSLTLTFTETTSANVTAKAASSLPIVVTTSTESYAAKRGSSSLTITLTAATAAIVTAKGASSLPIVFTTTTGTHLDAFGRSSLPIVFTFTTSGFVPVPLTTPGSGAAEHDLRQRIPYRVIYGKSSLVLHFDIDSNGVATVVDDDLPALMLLGLV